MNILALDLGTKTGVAHNVGNDFKSETWELSTPKEIKAAAKLRMDRRNDSRIHELALTLQGCKPWINPNIVIFEDVQFSSYTLQVQLWSSLRAAVWLTFPPSSGVILECVPVGTLKKFATGHGGATKDRMLRCLQEQHPAMAIRCGDDNAVDACWLWLWAKAHLTNCSKSPTV